jgi:uncharacterized protein (DUF1697 family)
MTPYIALLRGVNVGGSNKLPMATLRALLTDLGAAAPQTLLQSGNAVFSSKDKAPALESKIERALLSRLSIPAAVIIRSAPQWHALLAANPFPTFAAQDPSHLVITLFKSPPSPAAVAALRKAYSGPEQFELHNGALYLTYPQGIGTSRLTPALINKHLQSPNTSRNWNTATKLAEMLSALMR